MLLNGKLNNLKYNSMTEEETRNSLQVWYDGYHFSEVGADIYTVC